MLPDIESLFAPLGATAFFEQHYEKCPLLLAAEDDSRRGLLSHDELLGALARLDAPPEGLVCFPEQFGVTMAELWTKPELLNEYLEAGHPIVWNRARGVFPGIDSLTELLANNFGAHVWPNVYATGMAGTPFDMHFDAHEVITIQCAGEKEWTISEVRVDRPVDVLEMEAALAFALRQRRDEAEKRSWGTFNARPGDLVYIPRGQFHNARAIAGRSLHVTFGIRLPTGFDLAKQIVAEMLGDSRMREYLLPPALDPAGNRTEAWSAEVASRIEKAFAPRATVAAVEKMREAWVEKSGRGG